MQAIEINNFGGPDAAALREVGSPESIDGEVLIDVHAAGVSYPDLLLAYGKHQLTPPLPFILGYEVSGVVCSAPHGGLFSAGDRVAAIPHFGGYAQQVAADPRLVFPLPDGMDFATAAALPLNYLTVDYAFVRRGDLEEGETVLVQGAAGGIGTAAIQVARALGARVIGVTSSAEKAAVAEKAGAHHVVRAEGFRDSVLELTDGQGVDVVLDPVAGERLTDSLRSLRPEGRLLLVGFAGGEIPSVKVSRLLNREIDIRGVAWARPWWLNFDYLPLQWARLAPHIESGRVAPIVGASYPLAEASRALRDIEERRAKGKLVLQVA